MNSTLYAENPYAARKIAFKEDYELLQNFLVFYRDSNGLKKYYAEEDTVKIAAQKTAIKTVRSVLKTFFISFIPL